MPVRYNYNRQVGMSSRAIPVPTRKIMGIFSVFTLILVFNLSYCHGVLTAKACCYIKKVVSEFHQTNGMLGQ